MPVSASTPFILTATVGLQGVANKPADVLAVQQKLQSIRASSTRDSIPLRRLNYVTPPRRTPPALAVDLRGTPARGIAAPAPTGAMDDMTLDWILEFQSIFMRTPDGVISPTGTTAKFLGRWSVSPIDVGVQWQGQLKTAWLMVSPLLPAQSRCTSAYRSAEDQKRIIDRMFLTDYAAELKRKLGARYAAIAAMIGDARYAAMVAELRAINQAVALPGRSPHQRGKAFDIGGPNDAEQVTVCKLVAATNDSLFSGKILKERNGCVHVEIV